MNYNTLCLKLSSCLHSSTLTPSLCVLFTFLSASLLYASLLPCLSSQPLLFAFFLSSIFHLPSCPLLLYSSPPPFIHTPIYFDIYLSFSFPLCSFFAASPPLIYSPLCAARFASLPPLLLPIPLLPSHLRHTHLALPPFIASGGWRATVSFNPSQCHLQTLTVTRATPSLSHYQSRGAIKGWTRGAITAARAAD